MPLGFDTTHPIRIRVETQAILSTHNCFAMPLGLLSNHFGFEGAARNGGRMSKCLDQS